MLYNQYKITIPNVFIYNIELRGKDYIQMKQKESALHATAREGGTAGINKDFTILAQETTFISQNLPAIRQDEPYCWCPEDYKVQISFDLQGTNFPTIRRVPLFHQPVPPGDQRDFYQQNVF